MTANATADPVERQIVQYVKGEELGRQEIFDKFQISTLRIGPAEIGDWGQSFRMSPRFAVRGSQRSNRRVAVFNAALNSDELQNLYEQGRPLGY